MSTIVHGKPAGPPRHPAPHPHHAAPAPHPPKAKSRRGWVIAGAIALAAAAAAGLYAVNAGPDALTPEERLVKEIQDAANGSASATHVFGGGLAAAWGERGMTVVVKDVPPKACVSAAWRLAREGIVTVNGTTPVRISAAILSELCAEEPKGATVAWSPRESK